MNFKRNSISLWLFLIVTLVTVLMVSVSCWGSSAFDLVIENQTEHIFLTIYVNNYEVGNVGPSSNITREDALWDSGKYRVEARNTQREIVFDKTFARAQMQRIESRVYKVVIPPL